MIEDFVPCPDRTLLGVEGKLGSPDRTLLGVEGKLGSTDMYISSFVTDLV